jgi:hypothetical protein
MNTTRPQKRIAAAVVLAICSACGGPSTVAQHSAPAIDTTYAGKALSINGRPVTAARVNLNAPLGYAAILPDQHASPRTFEYVISDYGSYASIFDYPTSVRQIGSIRKVGGQGCTNVLYGYGKKTFWIVAASDQITEYQVPQGPIKTLSVAYSFPSSCAMDSSGDLAVGILEGTGGGDVVIFKNASGTGTAYPTPLDEEFFDGYDSQGNLFADGFSRDRFDFALVELPKGGTKFKLIKTSNSVEFPGSVQWDGKYVTITDQDASVMYRYTVSGTKATLKSSVSLSGAGDCAQTWIATGVVYCGDAGLDGAEVFKYPAGGSPIAILKGKFDDPLGAVAARR